MKRISILVPVCLLLGALAAAQAVPTETANAQKARELLDKVLAALGGPAYLSYADMVQEGRTYGFYKGEARGTGAPFRRLWKWPDKERIEMFKDRDWIILYNGEQGYDVTFRGAAPADDKDLRAYLLRRQYSLENVLRVWLKEPGVALFYDGKAVRQRRDTEQVTILNSRNQGVTLYLDSTTLLPLEKSYTVRDPESRERDEESEVYDNYRLVQGIMTPHSITRLHNGDMTNQRFLHSVSYNSGIADVQFTPASAVAAVQKK